MTRSMDPAERVYRFHVLPLAVLGITGGLAGVASALALLVPALFVRAYGATWARVLFACFAGAMIPIGIGLALRARVAWHAMFVHAALLWGWFVCSSIVALAELGFGTGIVLVIILGTVIVGLIEWDLYAVMKPVFRGPRRSTT